jgi:hypothetical protein
MRIVDRVYHDVSPSELDGHETETAHVQLYSGNPYGAASVAERNGLCAPGVCQPSNDGSSRSHREPSASRGSPTGILSRLLSCIIKGFAVCGEAMGPGCFGLGLHVERQHLERSAQLRGQSEHVRGADVDHLVRSNLPDLDETATDQTMASTTRTSPIGGFGRGCAENGM